MAKDTTQDPTQDAPKLDTETGEVTGAWALDERFGLRLDRTFSVGDQFMLYGAVSAGIVKTDIGDAEAVSLLVQKLDDNGQPHGLVFKVNTLARAIVEKMSSATPGDFPAIVELGKVHSKRFNRDALIITKVGTSDASSLFDEFNVPAEARASAGQIPY